MFSGTEEASKPFLLSNKSRRCPYLYILSVYILSWILRKLSFSSNLSPWKKALEILNRSQSENTIMVRHMNMLIPQMIEMGENRMLWLCTDSREVRN